MIFHRALAAKEYHSFYGRVVHSDGREAFVSVNLGDAGYREQGDLEGLATLVHDIHIDYAQRKRCLLESSPGYIALEDGHVIQFVPLRPEELALVYRLVNEFVLKDPRDHLT